MTAACGEHTGDPAARQGLGRLLAHVQEVCAYSSDTRFTAHAGAGGGTEDVALLQLRMSPRATVKLAGPLSKGASVLVGLNIYGRKLKHVSATLTRGSASRAVPRVIFWQHRRRSTSRGLGCSATHCVPLLCNAHGRDARDAARSHAR